MQETPNTARLATLDKILTEVAPNFLNPVPSRDTMRNWLDAARVPRLKMNPAAKRGGGPCYYQLSAVERLFRQRCVFVPRVDRVLS